MTPLIVFLSATGLLAFEIVLMRAFSIAQWHHFAAMIISVALLGFGLSGALLRKCRGRVGLWAAGFALSAPVCGWLALHIPFSPFLILWQPRQLLFLLMIYLLLLIPFTLGALVIGVALDEARRRGQIGPLYALNLVGSGLGGLVGLACCFLPLPVRMSEYKAMQRTLAMAGARIVETQHHPLGRVDVVECPVLRIAPGLSFSFTGNVPAHAALFVDGDGGSAVCREPLRYLAWLPSAAAYQLGPVTNALIIGVGGGAEMQQARLFGAQQATGVELHPLIAARAKTVESDGRAYIRRCRERYDVIQVSLLDAPATTAMGVGAANVMYLYTIEAFREFLAHLTDAGVLSVTRWLDAPARDGIKLLATAIEALGDGAADRIVFLRGWATGTVLVKRTALTHAEIAAVRGWAETRGFDVDYFPGIVESDANQRNVMAEPTYFRAAQSLLTGHREELYRDYPFHVRPATDDCPYFSRFFRWQSLPAMWRLMGRQGLALAEWGYLAQVAAFVQATALSLLLLGLLPLLARRVPLCATLAYFGSIGAGFMFLEMALLQKFVLWLGHPLYAASLVITTMLLGAGAGSALAGKLVRTARWPALGVVIFAVLTCWSGWFLAPLAVALGMMFPVGFARVGEEQAPWAWGVNGCASVIGATLGSVLAMDLGFNVVLVLAAGLYAMAAVAFRWLR